MPPTFMEGIDCRTTSEQPVPLSLRFEKLCLQISKMKSGLASMICVCEINSLTTMTTMIRYYKMLPLPRLSGPFLVQKIALADEICWCAE